MYKCDILVRHLLDIFSNQHTGILSMNMQLWYADGRFCA